MQKIEKGMNNMGGMTALVHLLALSAVAALVLMGTAVGEVSREGLGIMQCMRRGAAGMSVFFISYFKNHREHRGHREKWQPSAISVYSVVDCLCKYSFFPDESKKVSKE